MPRRRAAAEPAKGARTETDGGSRGGHEPAVAAPAPAAAFLPGLLLPRMGAAHELALERMQRVHGNRAVARMLIQRDPPTPTNIAPPAPAAIPQELTDYRARGPQPAAATGTLINTPTSPGWGGGAFNARYDPASMNMTVTVNVGMTFANGLNLTGNRAVANDPSLNGAAQRINRLPRAQRAAEVAKWQWSGEQETWMTNYKSSVTSAWATAGTGLTFQSSHTGWESQLARVNVSVNTQNVTTGAAIAPGNSAIPAGAFTHCNATIYKTPDGNDDFGAAVGGRDAAGQTSLSLGSSQTVVNHGHGLTQAIFFRRGQKALTARHKAYLDKVIFSFQTPTGGTGTSITITGHADTVGGGTPAGDARNQAIALERATAVADYLKATRSGGVNMANATARIGTVAAAPSASADATAQSRRVDIAFAGGGGQNVAAHEFGHMLGLDDLYVSEATPTQGLFGGTGGATGAGNADDARTNAAGLGRSTYENNDNVMSMGSTVRAPQYITFLEALKTVSGSNEWRLKA